MIYCPNAQILRQSKPSGATLMAVNILLMLSEGFETNLLGSARRLQLEVEELLVSQRVALRCGNSSEDRRLYTPSKGVDGALQAA
jgi:hypothetical protein